MDRVVEDDGDDDDHICELGRMTRKAFDVYRVVARTMEKEEPSSKLLLSECVLPHMLTGRHASQANLFDRPSRSGCESVHRGGRVGGHFRAAHDGLGGQRRLAGQYSQIYLGT